MNFAKIELFHSEIKFTYVPSTTTKGNENKIYEATVYLFSEIMQILLGKLHDIDFAIY